MSTGMLLTTQGRNLLALALTGKPLVFSRAYCGDGTLPPGQDPAALSSLISPKRELPIQSINTLQGIGSCEVVLEMSNKNLTQGFFVREYGLFAIHPDTQQEVLYAYRNSGDNSGYIEGDNGIDIINYTLSIVTVIDQAPNVSAILSSSHQYVTISRLDSRISALFGQYLPPKGFWCFGQDNEQLMRPATLQQTRQALWGDVDILSFNSRIERLEDAVNQTMLRLELLSDYPGYSHYSAEDFRDTNQIDQFYAHITSIIAGDDSIDVNPIDGMLPGSIYTISDGINSERVQVRSINLENGIQRIILEDTVKNTYILDTAQIYRTSTRINNSVATGPNARIKISWTPDLLWTGTGELENFTVALDTSINNQKAYSLEGSISIDASGLVTLN